MTSFLKLEKVDMERVPQVPLQWQVPDEDVQVQVTQYELQQ